MPRFEPFRGTRYASPGPDPTEVTAPPYDVLSAQDRADLAAAHPHNIVHVDVPVAADGPGRYAAAAATLDTWRAAGVLVTDPEPAFYVYRMAFTGEDGAPRTTVGVVGALEVGGQDADVLPHEQTTPKDATDRLELTRATGANLSPVWGLSLAGGLAELLRVPGTPLASVVDPDGVSHHLERVDDPVRAAAIGASVTASPVVIADGHHRYHVARTYAEEQRAEHGGEDGPWDLTLTLVVPLQPDHLEVRAIHRLLRCTEPGWDPLAHLDEFFEPRVYGLVDAGLPAELVASGSLCFVYADGMGVLLTPRPEMFAMVRDLDTARLEHALAGAPVEVRYQHGMDKVVDAVRRNEADWGVLLRPVTVAQIATTAHERTLMPPKSTFFTPKPRTGLVLRRLADG
jgi:uncharacterized protein (DUF1015 family)